MKTKILIVISNLNVGGAERHLMQVLPRLDRKKFNISIYVTREKGTYAPYLKELGINIYFSRFAKNLHRFGKVGRLFAYIFSSIRLFGLMLFLRPSIVHSYLPGPYLMGTLCGALTFRPYLLMSRRIIYTHNNGFLYRTEKFLHRFLKIATACSSDIAKQLCEEGLPKNKVVTIHNGVDLDRFSLLPSRDVSRKDLKFSEKDFIILIVANLYLRKAHTDLLKALSLIKKDLPAEWKLICVGRDGGELTALKKEAKSLDIHQNIIWVGETKNVLPYFCAADIGVLCSYEEGFSNALLESMAAGLPMVVTNVSGSNEAIEHGRTGLVIPTRSPEKLSEAILQLANSDKLREQLSVNVKICVNSKFS